MEHTSDKIKAEFENDGLSVVNFDIICAFYNERGEMICLQTVRNERLSHNESKAVEFALPEEAATYKLFAWDSLKEMQPVMKADNDNVTNNTRQSNKFIDRHAEERER